jgi:hypothetical protein
MKSSLHRLIPFLPLLCNCQFRRHDSIRFLCSQVHILAGWRLETRLHSMPLLSSFGTLLYNDFAQNTQKTQPLYCWECVFTAPLHSNGSYSIVACVFVAVRICLPTRCLAMNVYWLRYSGFRASCHNIQYLYTYSIWKLRRPIVQV